MQLQSHKTGMVLMAGLLVLLHGCGCSSRSPQDKNILQVGNGAEVQELDPHIVSGVTEHRVLTALFEGLADCDASTLEAVPAAAERWEISEDGLQYTFYMRGSARWSNGDPVTAHDFAYAWQRILTPALASEYAYMLYCLKNARAYHEGTLKDFNEVGVRVKDAGVLQVELEHPTPYFLAMQNHYAWFPVHKGTIESFGAMAERGTRWTRPGNLVSNGPFTLTSWLPNELLSVRRNPHYWDAESVRLDGIDFHPIDNHQTEERAFRSGLLHITSTIPLHRIAVYRKNRPEVLHIHPYYGSYFYRLNVSRPPFNNPLVRKAFAYALDREEIVNNVLKGDEQPGYHFVPPGDLNYVSKSRVAFNVERARSLMAEAGYPEGRGFPMVEILYNTSEAHRTIAETVQRMWREYLNVEVRLLNQDWKVYLSSMNNLDYDVARSAWIGDVADAINFLECFQTDVGNNRTGWSSPRYDALIQESYQEADIGKRTSLLQEAEALLLEESPIIPIYFYTWKFLKAVEMQGFKPNILGYLRWKDIYLDSGED